jgi:hypothetical protein
MASVHMGQIFARCTKVGNAACAMLPFKVYINVTLENCQKGLDWLFNLQWWKCLDSSSRELSLIVPYFWFIFRRFCIYVSVQKIDAVIDVRLVLFKSLIILPSDATNSAVLQEGAAMKPQIFNTGLQKRQFSTASTEGRQFPCSWYGSIFRRSSSLSIPIIRTTVSLWDTNEYSGKM